MDKPYSEQTSQLIDEEVRTLVKSAHRRGEALLAEKRAEVEMVLIVFFYYNYLKLFSDREIQKLL